MTAGPGTSNRASAAATKRIKVEASGIAYPLRRLRFPGRLSGAATDHGEPQVHQCRYRKGEEQAVIVEALDKRWIRERSTVEAGGGGGFEETRKDEGHADEHGHNRPPVPAVSVRVAAVHLVELGEVELPPAHDPVVYDHHGPDGPEEAAVANEPGEDVGAGGFEDQPGKREHADHGGDDATCPERYVLGRQVREVERRRDHVRRHVSGDLGNCDDEHGEDKQGGDIASKSRYEGDGVPDRLIEDDDGRRGDRDPDKGEGRHREREAKDLADDLRALSLRVAGKVRNVEGEGDPVTHVRREAGPEERPERCVALLEFG